MHPQVFLAARQLRLGAVEALQRGLGFMELVLWLPIMICRCSVYQKHPSPTASDKMLSA